MHRSQPWASSTTPNPSLRGPSPKRLRKSSPRHRRTAPRNRSKRSSTAPTLARSSSASPKPRQTAKRRKSLLRSGRAQTGGSLFSGFNSFLPAPKNAGKASAGRGLTRPGVNLKTSAAPGFSREEETGGEGRSEASTGELSLPPKRQAEPAIPEGQKSADEVKLVGKPLMFKPLSVARNPKKKSSKLATATPAMTEASRSRSGTAQQTTQLNSTAEAQQPPAPAPAPKKVSLFSMHVETPAEPSTSSTPGGAYEPLFETGAQPDGSLDEYSQYAAQAGAAPTTAPAAESLDSIANDLNLSAAARRELFGRGGGARHTAKQVVNFNMDQEYEHNEAIRAAGDQQTHNPVRAIQGGKHSLKQLVQNVHNQREALEESFAKGKSNRKEASSRYGWA